jgi:hypothetical protein
MERMVGFLARCAGYFRQFWAECQIFDFFDFEASGGLESLVSRRRGTRFEFWSEFGPTTGAGELSFGKLSFLWES